MNTGLISIIVLIAMTIFAFFLINSAKAKHSDETNKTLLNENKFNDLRALALNVTSEKLNVKLDNSNEAIGIIMEWRESSVLVNLVAFSNGDASMYFQSGQSIIGGGKNERIYNASKRLIAIANQFIDSAEPNNNTNYPPASNLRFYLITDESRYILEDTIDNLNNGSSKLNKLYQAANEIVGYFGEIYENKQ